MSLLKEPNFLVIVTKNGKIMRCVIVGSNGLLGTALMECQTEKEDMTLVPVSHRDIDISVLSKTLKVLKEIAPDVIINCAAYTNVDKCESEESFASQINGDGPFNLGMAALVCGSYFLHISTDYVFDGKSFQAYTESDQASPINAYGRSKMEGEEMLSYLVAEKGLKCCIVRTSWLFGPHSTKKDFVARMASMITQQGYAFGVLNEFGCPTYSCDLAKTLLVIAKLQPKGIYHCCNSGGFISRLDWVEAIADHIGGVVHPITAQDAVEMFNLQAIRPHLSALCCNKMKIDMNIEMRHWKDSVITRLKEL